MSFLHNLLRYFSLQVFFYYQDPYFVFFFLCVGFLGDFMTRNGNTDNTKSSASNTEFLKDNYKALLNKLVCPNCGNFQSFEEFNEKIRECRQCKEKFVKSKTSKSATFEKKNRESEEKRLLKLKSIEEELYGRIG